MMTLIKKLTLPLKGTATAASPAPFDLVSGNIYFSPYGSNGGTGDARGGDSCYGQMNLGGSFPRTFVGAWLMIKLQGTMGANVQFIIRTDTGMHLASSAGFIQGWSEYVWQSSPLTAIDPNNQWIFFGMAASLVSGTGYDLKYWYKTLTGPMTAWASTTNANIFAAITNVKFGMGMGNTNNPVVEFAYTSPCAYTYDNNDFSDISFPADLVSPPTRGDYYVNPGTGNDANDGMTPATAWWGVKKINEMTAHVGILPSTSYATGSKLIIDTNTPSSTLNIQDDAPNGLFFNTRGMTVIGGPDPDPFWNERIYCRVTYPMAPYQNWTLVGNNVYSHTPAQAASAIHCVVWEDSAWMNHPIGTTYAAVQASMESTPGSFWCEGDGSKIYIHAFGSTDPRTGAKDYRRSFFPDGARINLMAPDMDICGFILYDGTCDVQNDGQSQGGYGIGSSAGGFGGFSRVRKAYVVQCGKHAIGFTNDMNNSEITIEDCQVEQCSPYSSQTCFVNYMADTGNNSRNNVLHYRRNLVNKNSGLIGSYEGTNSNQQVWICHNNGTGVQWSGIEFTDNNFPRGSIQTGMVDTFKITGGRLGAVAAYSPNTICERVYFDAQGLQVITADVPGRNIVRNCIIAPEVPFSGGSFEGWSLQGHITIEGCTFDLTKIPQVQPEYPILWLRYTPLDLIFRNNIVKSDGRLQVTRFGLPSDTLVFHHNAYFGLRDGVVALYYDQPSGDTLLTLSEWQALGKDASTFIPADLMLDANLKPLAGSPVIEKGQDLGTMSDYTGVVFSSRNDIGAYEVSADPSKPSSSSGGDNYDLLYAIAQNTAGQGPRPGDGMYGLAYKIAANTGGSKPRPGDGIYDLFYKAALNTAGTPPRPGDRLYDLLFKLAGNTGSNKPAPGDGTQALLSKIAANTQ
jgi:hypothetical protein